MMRSGGLFRTTMQSPEGAEFPNAGCYLEVVPQEKLVWTNALLPGYRPSKPAATCGADEAAWGAALDQLVAMVQRGI